MSSDSSSVKEEIKKEIEEGDNQDNLLKVKKRKAPMIRLNSKPVLTLLSSNNHNVKAFKD
jgi:hypothetical protein